MKTIITRIPEDLHFKLKLWCLHSNVSQQKLFEAFLRDQVLEKHGHIAGKLRFKLKGVDEK